MSWSRREFLTASSVFACGLAVPEFLRNVRAATPKADAPGGLETVLVVLEMAGGNDGLNTVIPYRDEDYAKARPTLRQSPSDVKTIDDRLAFHPSMTGFAELLEQSQLSIVQGIGYPDPNRSHFVSMDIWHKASKSQSVQYGWLARALADMDEAGSGISVGVRENPLALFGARGPAPALRSLDDYQLKIDGRPSSAQQGHLMRSFADAASTPDNELLGLVQQSVRDAYQSAEQLGSVRKNYQTPITYPANELANRLKLIAQLIDSGVPERVYYVSMDGFDTHAIQASAHARLLEELSGSLAAFQKDLVHHGHAGRVLTMTFSEFGRRVQENGSGGTDHGAASQMFLIGDAVQAGPVGEHPSLTDLHSGDLVHHTDFRSVYATVLENWLGVSSEMVIGAEFPKLDLLRTPAPVAS